MSGLLLKVAVPWKKRFALCLYLTKSDKSSKSYIIRSDLAPYCLTGLIHELLNNFMVHGVYVNCTPKKDINSFQLNADLFKSFSGFLLCNLSRKNQWPSARHLSCKKLWTFSYSSSCQYYEYKIQGLFAKFPLHPMYWVHQLVNLSRSICTFTDYLL